MWVRLNVQEGEEVGGVRLNAQEGEEVGGVRLNAQEGEEVHDGGETYLWGG